MNLDIENMVFTAAMLRHTNVAEIARELKMTPSNLYRKIKSSTIKPWELAKIGKVLGGEYVYYLSFPDGTKVGKFKDYSPAKKKNVTKQKAASRTT